MDNDKSSAKCSFNTSRVTKEFVVYTIRPYPINCIVKPVLKATIDPCFQQQIMHQAFNNSYYQHMPKYDAVEAARYVESVLYAARMGGEHHDGSGCTIL